MTQELKLFIGFMAAFIVYTVIVFSGGAYAAYAWKNREVNHILTLKEITEAQDGIREIVTIHDEWLTEDRDKLDQLQEGYDSLARQIHEGKP